MLYPLIGVEELVELVVAHSLAAAYTSVAEAGAAFAAELPFVDMVVE